MNIIDIIRELLCAKFDPIVLEVIDESGLHKGHAGWIAGVTTHIKIIIQSKYFAGIQTLKVHTMIYDELRHYFKPPLHSISIEVKR